jgi:hypothetical protein
LFYFWLHNHSSLYHFLCSNNFEAFFVNQWLVLLNFYLHRFSLKIIYSNTFTSCTDIPISIQFFKT